MSKSRPENVKEVEAYFFEIGGDQETANAFLDYREMSGWKLSGNRDIKDWKAAARTWMRNTRKWARPKEYPGANRVNAGLSDADISRQAKPGETWEEARLRLMRTSH